MEITLCSVETHGPYVLAELLLDGCPLRTVLQRYENGTLTTEALPREIEGRVLSAVTKSGWCSTPAM